MAMPRRDFLKAGALAIIFPVGALKQLADFNPVDSVAGEWNYDRGYRSRTHTVTGIARAVDPSTFLNNIACLNARPVFGAPVGEVLLETAGFVLRNDNRWDVKFVFVERPGGWDIPVIDTDGSVRRFKIYKTADIGSPTVCRLLAAK